MKRAPRLMFVVMASCLFGSTAGLLGRQVSTVSPTTPIPTPPPPVTSPTTSSIPPTEPISTPTPTQPASTLPSQPLPSSTPLTSAAPTSATSVIVAPQPSTLQTTDATGSTSLVVVTNSLNTAASQTSSAAPSETSSSSGGGLGTGTIVGLSVAGGIAVLVVIAFFVWKFSKKRFSDFDDNEAIKWPELNTHGDKPDSHPLPVNNTGRAGFGNEDTETTLSRGPSHHSYADSTPDVGSVDPYAVPPLPHLNPNQPYRDDPTPDPYYDPYSGPVPNAFTETDQGRYTDAIPMTQMAPSGRRSPGPQMAYDAGRASPRPSMGGRTSPGPQAALGFSQGYERTMSPGPVGYTSPERRPSPGPGVAYGGRQSPGPQNAYR